MTGDITGAAGRVAETLAKGQAAAGVLKAAEAPPSSVSSTFSAGAAGGTAVAGGNAAATAPAATDVKAFVTNFAIPACGGCHSGNDPKGKLDITKWESFDPERKAEIYERLTTRDKEKRMPRLADGGPGALSKEQLKAFVSN